MQQLLSAKYCFRIRTRNGAIVDNLSIFGNDEVEAERKLRQIYQGCEILESHQQAASLRGGALTYEDVVDLISSGPAG